MSKKKMLIFIFLILAAIAVGVLWSYQQNRPIITTPQPSSLTSVNLTPLNLSNKTMRLQWLNDQEMIYTDGNSLYILGINAMVKKSLPTPNGDTISFLTTRNNMAFIQTGSAFSDKKVGYLMKNQTLSEINLNTYGSTKAFSFSPLADKLYFIALFNPSTNNGKLHVLDIQTSTISPVGLNDINFDSLEWTNDSSAFTLEILDAQDSNTVSLLNLNTFAVTAYNPFGQSIDLPQVSPDQSKALVKTSLETYLITLGNISTQQLVQKSSSPSVWLNNNEIIAVSSTTSGILDKIDVITLKTTQLNITQLTGKTITSLIASSNRQYLLINTKESGWFLFDTTNI